MRRRGFVRQDDPTTPLFKRPVNTSGSSWYVAKWTLIVLGLSIAIPALVLGALSLATLQGGGLGMIQTDAVCPNVLLHEQDGIIPSTHEMHHLQGPAPPPPATPIVAPLDVLADGPLSGSATPVAGGLKVRSVVSPTSIVDRGAGVKWVQLGVPEPTFYFDEFQPGDTPPFDGQLVSAEFSVEASAFPTGMKSVIVDLELDLSTETGYDFVRVFKNNQQIPGALYSGWNSETEPFISVTISDIALDPLDRIEVRFSKDSIFLGGLDYALVRPVNMRYVPASVPLTTSLESDLTGYVGKRIRVCSLDGDVHTINASPAKINYEAAQWSSIRFQRDAMCCIEFTALGADKLDITSGISPKCALVCEGEFCIDPNAPEESNSLVGDWLMQDLSYGNEYWSAMMRISREGNDLKVTRYSGTPFWNIREWSQYEESLVGASSEFAGGVIPKEEIVTVTGDGEMEFSTIIRVADLKGTFKVQADGVTGITASTDVRYDFASIGTYRKIPTGSINIVPSEQSGAVSGYESNSLINQFKEFAAITQTMYNPQMADDLESSVYPGELAARALLEKIISEGYGSYSSNVTDVWPSFQNCIYFCGAGAVSKVTSIFTDQFTEASQYVRVTISGFGTGSDPTSPYTMLNGNHRVKRGGEESMAYRDLKEIYTSNHYSHANHRYMINIDIDTSSIRDAGRIYNPDVDGKAVFEVHHLPVTENMSPGDYFAAVHKWLVSVVFQTHTYIIFPVAFNHDAFETFEALHYDAENFGAEVDYGDARFSFPANKGGSRSTGTLISLLNDKYEQPAIGTGSNPTYHTPQENYVSEIYNFWWAIDPNTTSDPSKITGKLVSDYGYNADGSRFMITYAPVGSTPTFPYPGAPQAANGTAWSIVSGFGSSTARALSFGRIKSDFVSEETAYMFIPDEVQFDPQQFMITSLFYPDGSQGYPDLSDFNDPIYIYIWSVGMEKIMSWNPTRIIIDTRTNGGGFAPQVNGFASFMGDTRTSIQRNSPSRRVGYGHEPIITADTLHNSGIQLAPPGIDAYIADREKEIVNVQRVKEIFGNSTVFQGAGKRVTILTSTVSASSGDILPWYFVGDSPGDPRNMGAGVTLEIVGNIDGRHSGGSVVDPFSLTVTSDTLFNNLGEKRSYIRSTAENIDTRRKPGYPSMVNQQPATAPDLLLNSFVGYSSWVDEGYITPYPDAPLPGWTAAGAIQEITQVDCVGGGSVTQSGVFTVTSLTATYTVWYNVNGGGVASGANPVEVAIASGDSADAVTIATVNALGAIGDFFVEFVDTDTFTIRNKIAGAVSASVEVNSGNTISQTQASASGVVGEVLTTDRSTWRDRWLEKAILF